MTVRAYPHFESTGDFQHLIDLIMRHYNGVLASLALPGRYELLFDIDTRNGDVLWRCGLLVYVLARVPRVSFVAGMATVKDTALEIGVLHVITAV